MSPNTVPRAIRTLRRMRLGSLVVVGVLALAVEVSVLNNVPIGVAIASFVAILFVLRAVFSAVGLRRLGTLPAVQVRAARFAADVRTIRLTVVVTECGLLVPAFFLAVRWVLSVIEEPLPGEEVPHAGQHAFGVAFLVVAAIAGIVGLVGPWIEVRTIIRSVPSHLEDLPSWMRSVGEPPETESGIPRLDEIVEE